MNEDLKELRANQSELSSALARLERKIDLLLSQSHTYKPVNEFLDVVDVATLCKVSQQCVYNWVSLGKLPKRKVNGRLLFSVTDIQDFLAHC